MEWSVVNDGDGEWVMKMEKLSSRSKVHVECQMIN